MLVRQTQLRSFFKTSIAFGVLLCLTASARAQAPTTVQLPSFSRFSYGGSVLVPDGGSAHLGSVKRAASGSSRRGLSRAFGSQQSISQASVHAQIIDLQEMDRQILGGTPDEFVRREQILAERLNAKRGSKSSKLASPDELGKRLVRQARKEWQSGDQSASFRTYRKAIRTLQSISLRDYAVTEFKRRFGAAALQSLQAAYVP